MLENEKLRQLRYHDERETYQDEEDPEKKPLEMPKTEVLEKDKQFDSIRLARGGTGGGRSGQGGFSPRGGVRIGGRSGGGSAIKVAWERVYRGNRSDAIIGVRRFESALRVLRELSRDEGPKDELNLDETINATCRNAGWLKVVWDRPRKNKMEIVLMMDSGGSMDSYIDLCSQLFTAVKRSTHFKALHYYYFHNCIYEDIYVKPACVHFNALKTYDFLRKHDPDCHLIIVGDASMAPFELTDAGGAIDMDHDNAEPGIVWLDALSSILIVPSG